MDFRKIIQLGHNTSVVSLPKQWIDQNKLLKGDALITEIHGNTIMFKTSEQQKSAKKTKTILISKNTPTHFIKRQLISAYENNATKILFKGDGLYSCFEYINSLVDSFIGLEIIEQTPEMIVAKTYILSQEINVETFVKRIDTTFRAVVTEFFDYYETKNPLLIQAITQKEINIDKLVLMMKRVIKERLNHAKLRDEKPLRLLDYWKVIENLEKISDILTMSALELQDKKTIEPLPKQASLARELFKKILDNFYQQNVQKANMYGDEIRKIINNIQKEYESTTVFEQKRLLRIILQISELIREINRLSY